MWRLMRGLAFILLALSLLAGCLGPGEGDPAPAPEPSEDSDPLTPRIVDPQTERMPRPDPADDDAGDLPRPAFRFPLEGPLVVRAWQNGSFAPQETGLGGGFVTGAFAKTIALGALVPPEVPVRLAVRIELDTETFPLVGPTARADPVSNGTTWYGSEWRSPATGVFEWDATVKRQTNGTLGVSLEAYAPATAHPPEVAYVVHVVASAHPERLPPGVPTSFRAEPDETLHLRAEGDEPVELLVHGPDDRLLDRLYVRDEIAWTAPADAADGLVVIPLANGGGLRIERSASDAAAGRLEALDVSHDVGQAHAVPPRETTTWTFELEERPLRVRLALVGPSDTAWTCTGSLTVTITGPTGSLLEDAAGCPSPTNVPFLYEERHAWSTDLGDPRLVPGTYTVHIDNTLWSGHQATHTIERYVR